MVFPQFSTASTTDEDDGTERAGLLSITDFPLTAAAPAASARSSSGLRSFLFRDNVGSYGSIANNNGATRTVNSGNNTTAEENVPTDSGEGGTVFADIEEGESRQHRNLGHREEIDDVSPAVETVNSADGGDDGTPNRHRREQQHQSNESPRAGETEEPRDGAIGNLTRRLRCLFSTITFPIVPLGTIVSMALLWVLYAATSLDLRKTCSHPLHSYAVMSFLLVAYIPNHSQVRSQIFHYSRERDGPIRPARVRMYDQFFHTVCLLYVYTGVTLIQTCREDLVNPNTAADQYDELTMMHGEITNACEATCPNLYQAMSVYVATLELFTFALILPLLFLPCIYLWFLQRATAEADAFSRLQERLNEEEALLSNGGVTTGEILDSMETVKIVRVGSPGKQTPKGGLDKDHQTSKETEVLEEAPENHDQLWILPQDATWKGVSDATLCETRECCICMSEFDVQVVQEDESQSGPTISPDQNVSDHESTEANGGGPLHQTCHGANDEGEDGCDEDGDDLPSNSSPKKEATIVRTSCGHIFHKECLRGWVGGMWTANIHTNGSNSGDDTQPDWRKRKARQIHCPLCRKDLRPMPYTN